MDFDVEVFRKDELCPCGSGKLFFECCEGNTPVVLDSKKPINVVIMEKLRASRKKCCLHPDQKNCRGKIKAAHALQNNKIISQLAGNERHVYMLAPKKIPTMIAADEEGKEIPFVMVERISANDATTETCFCDYHDDIAFAIIEKGAPEYNGSKEMSFVYAYKAFIFEYYRHISEYRMFRAAFKSNPYMIQSEEVLSYYRMLQLKDKEYSPVKEHYDSQILAGTYEGVYSVAVEMPEKIKFADYAFIAPPCDMNGEAIPHTLDGVMHKISLTIFPEGSRSWLLLSCLESEKGIYQQLFHQMKTEPQIKLKMYLNWLLPLYSENMVLSPELWNSWGEKEQFGYTFYANITDQMPVYDMAFRFQMQNLAKDESLAEYNHRPSFDLFL